MFIALIAQAYENAREDLIALETKSSIRTPAVNDPARIAKDTLIAKNDLRNMAVRKMISTPLAYSLREPLNAVENTLRRTHGDLHDLTRPKKLLDRMVWSNLSREERTLRKLQKSVARVKLSR